MLWFFKGVSSNYLRFIGFVLFFLTHVVAVAFGVSFRVLLRMLCSAEKDTQCDRVLIKLLRSISVEHLGVQPLRILYQEIIA